MDDDEFDEFFSTGLLVSTPEKVTVLLELDFDLDSSEKTGMVGKSCWLGVLGDGNRSGLLEVPMMQNHKLQAYLTSHKVTDILQTIDNNEKNVKDDENFNLFPLQLDEIRPTQNRKIELKNECVFAANLESWSLNE